MYSFGLLSISMLLYAIIRDSSRGHCCESRRFPNTRDRVFLIVSHIIERYQKRNIELLFSYTVEMFCLQLFVNRVEWIN